MKRRTMMCELETARIPKMPDGVKHSGLELKRLISMVATITVGLMLANSTEATSIEFEVANLGGTTWEYTYFVDNDTLGVEIADFIVLFDVTLFTNLHAAVAPPDWDPLVFQPDLLLPADGVYDALALVQGIAPGDDLGGFSVRADYIGVGAPGAQLFETYSEDFDFLDQGTTVARSAAVPEPVSWGFVLFGVAGIAVARRRRGDGF